MNAKFDAIISNSGPPNPRNDCRPYSVHSNCGLVLLSASTASDVEAYLDESLAALAVSHGRGGLLSAEDLDRL